VLAPKRALRASVFEGLRAERDSPVPIVSIPLCDDQVRQLRLRADQAGISLQEYLARCVGVHLDRLAEKFCQAAARVLEKNAELSRRLA